MEQRKKAFHKFQIALATRLKQLQDYITIFYVFITNTFVKGTSLLFGVRKFGTENVLYFIQVFWIPCSSTTRCFLI